MPIYFSKTGLEKKKEEIRAKELEIKKLQKEAADAAGVSYDWHDNFGAEDATRQAETEMIFLNKLMKEVENGKAIEQLLKSEKDNFRDP